MSRWEVDTQQSLRVLALLLALLASACGAQYPASSSTPLTDAELKYRLIDQFGVVVVCGPPVTRVGEALKADAAAAFADIQRDTEAFSAILRHLQLGGVTDFNVDQKVLIYSEYQRLKAITFDPSGDRQHFALLFADPSDAKRTVFVEGTIDRYGSIQVSRRESRGQPNCPICLAAGTRIATPAGAIAVEELREGMAIWTLDERGVRVAARVLRTARTLVAMDHQVVRLRLADEREVIASLGHPDARGRAIGSLSVGDILDGSPIVLIETVRYDALFTFDVLPSGSTGTYWADSVLLRSTLVARLSIGFVLTGRYAAERR